LKGGSKNMAIEITSSAQIIRSSTIIPSSLFNFNNPLTITVWIRKGNWVESGLAKSLVGIYNVVASAGIQLGLYNSAFAAWRYSGFNLTRVSSDTFIPNNWYFFTYIFTGTSSKMYVNGILRNSTNVVTQNGGIEIFQINSFPFNPSFLETSNDFAVSDYRVYSRILSLDEIRTVYNSRGRDSIVSDLKLRFPLNELPSGNLVNETYNIADSLTFTVCVPLSVQPSYTERINYTSRS
jgi:hypothetical protein